MARDLRGAATAEGPGEQAGEEDAGGAGEGGGEAQAEEGVAEEGLGEARLDGNEGAVVDEAPGKMAAAGEVVELVAEVAPAEMGRPGCGDQVEDQLDCGEGEGEVDGFSKAGGRWRGLGGGGGHMVC